MGGCYQYEAWRSGGALVSYSIPNLICLLYFCAVQGAVLKNSYFSYRHSGIWYDFSDNLA